MPLAIENSIFDVFHFTNRILNTAPADVLISPFTGADPAF
jgi:hypothetical protein